MDAFKEFFRLDYVLRNCIGGVAFYLVIYRETRTHFDISGYLLHGTTSWVNLVEILITVSLTGILLHAVERNTIAIFMESARGWVIGKREHLELLFPKKAKDDSVWRFRQLTEKERWGRINDWGASAHCLYTVSLAIFVAALYLYCGHASDRAYHYFLFYLCISFLFLELGFFSDVRKTLMESGLKENVKLMTTKIRILRTHTLKTHREEGKAWITGSADVPLEEGKELPLMAAAKKLSDDPAKYDLLLEQGWVYLYERVDFEFV